MGSLRSNSTALGTRKRAYWIWRALTPPLMLVSLLLWGTVWWQSTVPRLMGAVEAIELAEVGGPLPGAMTPLAFMLRS